MRIRVQRSAARSVAAAAALSFTSTAVFVGCSNNGGSTVAPIGGGGGVPVPTATAVPTGTGASPTPGPTGGSTASAGPTATATATATPTATPTVTATLTPTPLPTATASPAPGATATPISVGTTTCNATEPVPGTYTTIITGGVAAGSTYAGITADDIYTVDAYTVPTPTPTPTATPTPGPTFTPGPTPTPGPTGTPTMATIYVGTYSLPSFSGTGLSGGGYTTNPTNGCFVLSLTQPVGGTTGQVRFRRPFADPVGTQNAAGEGFPQFASDTTVNSVAVGSITAFTITNLTRASGSGTFTLDTGTSGTVTITGSTTFIEPGGPIAQAMQRRDAILRRLHRR